MNRFLWLMLVVYFLVIFGIALYAKYQGGKESFDSEYYLGGRSLGGWVLAMSMAATYASASSFIGGPAAAYVHGLGWVLLSMIQVPVVWLSLGALGKQFYLFSKNHQCLTINDVLMVRYRNKWVVLFSSLTLLLCFFATMTVQLIGAARLLEVVLGIDYLWALLGFLCVVGLYTVVGGFRAVVLTDVFQGFLMTCGAFILLGALLYFSGGLSQAMIRLKAIDPELLSPYGVGHHLDIPFMLSFWVLVCFGTVGLPQSALRVMAFKDNRSLHRAMLIGTVVLGVMMLCMHLSGVLGRLFVPELEVPDQIIPTLMIRVLPTWVWVIFLFAPISAIMSSIDAYLIQSSSVLVRDLWRLFFDQRPVSDKGASFSTSWRSYAVNILLLVLVFFNALNPPDLIVWINLFAFGALESCFFWVLVLGVFWEKANDKGAMVSMVVGMLSYVILYQFKAEWSLGSIHPIVYALSISGLSFVMVSFFTSQREE